MNQNTLAISHASAFDEDLWTWANAVTFLRTAGGLVLFSVAALERSHTWNLAGLAVYWGLDCLDGLLTRALNQETVFGAQIDILSDRFFIAFFYLNYLAMHPDLAIVIALFLFQFMVLDLYLSNQFIRWRLLSPNYFHVVDRTIWWLNWSVPGKVFNSGVMTILLLTTKSAWVVWLLLAGLFFIKIYSWSRLHRLPSRQY